MNTRIVTPSLPPAAENLFRRLSDDQRAMFEALRDAATTDGFSLPAVLRRIRSEEFVSGRDDSLGAAVEIAWREYPYLHQYSDTRGR
jgi:hypothetical protein